MTDIKSRIDAVKARISQAAVDSGRAPDAVRLVAVSKTHPAERVRAALAAGHTVFGENYIQEARDKIAALEDTPARWHFIGHLQTNKAKYAVRLFELIHSVDSLRLAEAIDREAEKRGIVQRVLIQVNIAGEASKSGSAPEAAAALVRQAAALPHLSVEGLMTMPPFFDDPDRARPFFMRLREIRDAVATAGPTAFPLPELSMGMTGDFEAAIGEGATLVRVGTAIFGGRS